MTETTSDPMGSLVFALLIVSVAIGLFAVIAFFLKKKFNLAALGQKLNAGSRLSVVETIAVDQKRKLVLIQKDGTEHLVLVGGPTDLVIETSNTTDKAHNTSTTNSEDVLNDAIQSSPATSAPALNSEQDAIDFFDQARDRIFAPQDAQSNNAQAAQATKAAKPVVRDDTDDFHSVLQSQQNPQRSRPLEPIPETAEERVNKLKALLDEAQKSRLNKN
ncbi:MAG: flagellar biosynthetic protein FliO [Lentilitoribacter sp.]